LFRLQQQAKVQLARLGGNPDISVTDIRNNLQAKAQVDEAQRSLITRSSSTVCRRGHERAVGLRLAISASFVTPSIVATDYVWSVPSKETELTYVRPGQPVTVTVDTYRGVSNGKARSRHQPGGAQEFQLLPAQNTSAIGSRSCSGFRCAWRVRHEQRQQGRHWRAGMSVEIDVDTGHARACLQFLAASFARQQGWIWRRTPPD